MPESDECVREQAFSVISVEDDTPALGDREGPCGNHRLAGTPWGRPQL